MRTHLLDSNAAIEYIGGILPEKAVAWLDGIIDSEVVMSVINRIEILSFNPADPADLLPFEELLDTVEVLPLSEEVIRKPSACAATTKSSCPMRLWRLPLWFLT